MLINRQDNFRNGFFSFLQSEKTVNLTESEFDDAVNYIKTHQQSDIGTWSEKEVLTTLLQWKVSTQKAAAAKSPITPMQSRTATPQVTATPTAAIEQKRQKALSKVENLNNIEQAKNMLHQMVELGYDIIFDTILNN